MSNELVKNIMTTGVKTMTSDTSLAEAHKLMSDNKIRRVPVVDNGVLKGIVTLGDVICAEPSKATSLSVWELNYLIAKLTVKEIMTRDPITVSETDLVSLAARHMLEKRIGGIPVLGKDGALTGIITESDIFRLVASDM